MTRLNGSTKRVAKKRSVIKLMNDLSIAHVKGDEKLMELMREGIEFIEWRTVKVDTVPEFTVVQSAYSETTIQLHIAISDETAKLLEKEYDKGQWQSK